jgi:Ca2+-binding EF-hand superfamily protein
MFAAIDTDNSGTISLQKLRTFMQRENVSVTEKEVHDRFDQMDSQKRGSVSQEEFLEAAKKDGFKATALFAAIDTDNSGKISIEKLRTFMQRKDSLVSEKMLQECFDQIDSKKMGSVSKEEFVEATIDCLVDSPKQHKSKEKVLSASSSDKSKGKVSSTLAASVKSLEKSQLQKSQLQELLEKYDLEDDADVLTKNGIKKESDLSFVNESVIKAMQLSLVSAAKLRKLVQDHGARALSPAKTPAGTVVRETSCQRVPLLYDYAQSAEEAPLLLSGGGSLADVEAGELEEALDANDRIVDELKDAIIKLRSNLEACGGSQYSNAIADVQAVSVKASQAAKESREKFENTVLKVSEERVASMRMLKTLEKKLASHLAARSAVSAAEDSELSRRIKETLSRNSDLLVCNCEQVPQVSFGLELNNILA